VTFFDYAAYIVIRPYWIIQGRGYYVWWFLPSSGLRLIAVRVFLVIDVGEITQERR